MLILFPRTLAITAFAARRNWLVIKTVGAFSREHRIRHDQYVKEKDRVLDRIRPWDEDDLLTSDERRMFEKRRAR